MIDLMALFTGLGTEAKPAKVAGQGTGGGIFATLLAALKAGGGETALPDGGAGLVQKMSGLIEGAEQALAVPDLSDAEIGDILDRLVEDLATLIATQPQIAAQVTGALALAIDMPDPEAAGADLPPRLVAEALPVLRRVLLGPVSATAAQATPAEAPDRAETSALAPLLTKIVAAVEDKRPGLSGQLQTFVSGQSAQVTPAAAEAPAATVSPVPLVTEAAARAAPLTDLPPPVAAPAPAPASPVAQAQPAMQAPPAPPLPVEPREVLAQVRAQVGEQGRIRVELRPDGLGAVEIDLSPDEAGQLRVVVRAENAAVLTALRGDRDGLLTLLRGAGHDVQDGAMSFGGFTGQGREGNPGATGPGWGPVLGGADTGAEETPAQPVLILGGVDMRV